MSTASHNLESFKVNMLRLRVAAAGVVRDFWKDGDRIPFQKKGGERGLGNGVLLGSGAVEAAPKARLQTAAAVKKPWKGDRVQVLEKIWGPHKLIPGDDAYLKALVSPLGLTKDMSVLDLSAGLGAMARYIAEFHGSYVTGLETDPQFAARGMVLSIAAGKSKHASIIPYDPAIYTASRKYDAVIARELFYRIIGKEVFFDAVDASLKNGGGHLVVTDYILDHADREKPAVKAWLGREPEAAPLASIEMIKLWKSKGYDFRISDDQTDEYKTMILSGLAAFVHFLSEEKPDAATKKVILAEIDMWVTRYMAMKEGLKYYRFYAIKR